ncbi:NAD(P)/FAD-dependent oxidoreductase [Rhodotorula paludigena]|uniref:NAD(P)/FAD-dependent oxidoreductase n=1 Tax=Rhodotorula paludigena TaxID=86838 RepID=UPI0031709EBC
MSKNIVIVGYGPAAAQTAQTLAPSLPSGYRIVAISSGPGYWPIAALRGAVVPGWEDKPIASTDNAFPKGGQHVLIEPATVVELRRNSIVLDEAAAGFDAEIPFEYCVLATGSAYPYPCRPRRSTFADAVADLRQTQQEVAAAKSILVIGGGPVGVEVAGEVAEYYNGKDGRAKKEITIVHSHDRFLHESGWKDKFNNTLKQQLEAYGINVILGQKVVDGPAESGKIEGGPRAFHLDNGQSVTADFVFVAHGNAPNTGLVRDFDASALDEKKRVRVRPSLQLENYDNIFAVGDITDVKEEKTFYASKGHAPVAAANILSLINASKPAKAVKPTGQMLVVTVGSKGGASQLPFGFVMGSWFTSFAKGKSLFIADFKKLYNAPA